MAGGALRRRNRAAAAPVSEGACAFCGSSDQDEAVAGQLYALENVTVHYYCALVSCGLCQKGKDEEGLFGFLLDDIINELQRGKKLKCSFCGFGGATVGCSVSSCKKQFHLTCGRRHGVLSLFYGNYESYCLSHAPQQKVSPEVMAKVKQRRSFNKKNSTSNLALNIDSGDETENICAICYDSVNAWPSNSTFWPPCCAKDRWLHSECVQRMALSAGMHYLKCPLCNDKDVFQSAAQERGVYIPDRDAAWELERDAFAELYERPKACCAEECLCVRGREYDADEGQWELQFCLMCGGSVKHAGCLGGSAPAESGAPPIRPYFCVECAALPPPKDIQALLPPRITRPAVTEAPEYRPLMPARMSIRRTKGALSGSHSCNTFKMEKIVKIIKEIDENESDEEVDVISVEDALVTSPIPSSSNIEEQSRSTKENVLEEQTNSTKEHVSEEQTRRTKEHVSEEQTRRTIAHVSEEQTRITKEHVSDNTRDSRLSLGIHSPKHKLTTVITRATENQNTKRGVHANSGNSQNIVNSLTEKEIITKSPHVERNNQFASEGLMLKSPFMKTTTGENDKDIHIKSFEKERDSLKDVIAFLDSNNTEKSPLTDIENHVLSPLKMIQDNIYAQLSENPSLRFSIDSNMKKMNKPGPKTAKKKIAGTCLNEILEHYSQITRQEKHCPVIHSTPTKTDITVDIDKYALMNSPINDARSGNYLQDEGIGNNNEKTANIVENIRDDETMELDNVEEETKSLNTTLTLEISDNSNSTVPLDANIVSHSDKIEELEFSNTLLKTVTKVGKSNECSKMNKIDHLESLKSHYLSEVDRSNKTHNFLNVSAKVSYKKGEEKLNEPKNRNKKSSRRKSAESNEDLVHCYIKGNTSDESIFAISENSLIKLQNELGKVDEQFGNAAGNSGNVKNIKRMSSKIKNNHKKEPARLKMKREQKHKNFRKHGDSNCVDKDTTDVIVIDNEESNVIKVAIKRKPNSEDSKTYTKKRKIEVSFDIESRNKDRPSIIFTDSKERNSKITKKGNSSITEKTKIKDGAKDVKTRKLCDDKSHNFIGDLFAIDDYYLNNSKKEKKKLRKQIKYMTVYKEEREQKILKQTILSFSPEDKKVCSTHAQQKKRKNKSHSPDGLKQTTLNSFFKVNITLS